MKTLVLGLGNPILTDDGVAVYAVRAAAARWTGDSVDFQEANAGGLRLLEVISGYDRLILVDAIQTPDGAPGQIRRLAPDDLCVPLHAGSTHDLSFRDALAWGRRMGMALPPPEGITIIAIEAEDVVTFGETLTCGVAAVLPLAISTVLAEIERNPRQM